MNIKVQDDDFEHIDNYENKLTTQHRLIELRKDKKLTQGKLALELGVPRSIIAAWEAGTRIPDGSKLRALSHFYKVSAAYIVGISDVKGEILIRPVNYTSLYR